MTKPTRLRRLRAIPVKAILKLDRPGGRTLLGLLITLSVVATNRELKSVRWSWRRGAWISRFREGRVIDARRWDTWQQWATYGGGYDMDELLFRHYRPNAGDVVVDVGAGDGGETFALARLVGSSGQVWSFEAAPTTFARLKALCQLNGWKHVHPIEAAVTDRPGTVMISDNESWETNNIYEPGEIAVRGITLDDACRERGIDHIDWLKMNIEGAEKDAVRGMEQMAPHIRNVTIACHDFLGTDWGRSKVQVIHWLAAHGFTVQERGDLDEDPALGDYVYGWRT